MERQERLYTLSATTLEGEHIEFSRYRGKVLLIVNTASACGYTPQYAGLQKLHEQYGNRGLVILGFPCNQFGSQEPGTSKDIRHFCSSQYQVSFELFEKIDVKGKQAHPLFKYLTQVKPGFLGTQSIKWNFTKFLVDRNGAVVARYAPFTVPDQLVKPIENLL
ncbi:MAG: glutathione peroxidase [Burkholderiales bacterium]|nr:glutathione peroxidase [Burkholderiales bacterium]